MCWDVVIYVLRWFAQKITKAILIILTEPPGGVDEIFNLVRGAIKGSDNGHTFRPSHAWVLSKDFLGDLRMVVIRVPFEVQFVGHSPRV